MSGRLALRLSPETEARLDELARKTGRSRAFLAREAILGHLEDVEDTYLAQEALEEHVTAGGRTITIEELLTRGD